MDKRIITLSNNNDIDNFSLLFTKYAYPKFVQEQLYSIFSILFRYRNFLRAAFLYGSAATGELTISSLNRSYELLSDYDFFIFPKNKKFPIDSFCKKLHYIELRSGFHNSLFHIGLKVLYPKEKLPKLYAPHFHALKLTGLPIIGSTKPIDEYNIEISPLLNCVLSLWYTICKIRVPLNSILKKVELKYLLSRALLNVPFFYLKDYHVSSGGYSAYVNYFFRFGKDILPMDYVNTLSNCLKNCLKSKLTGHFHQSENSLLRKTIEYYHYLFNWLIKKETLPASVQRNYQQQIHLLLNLLHVLVYILRHGKRDTKFMHKKLNLTYPLLRENSKITSLISIFNMLRLAFAKEWRRQWPMEAEHKALSHLLKFKK